MSKFKSLCLCAFMFHIFFGCSHEEDLHSAKSALISIHNELRRLNSRQEILQKSDVLEKKFLDLAQATISLRERGLTLQALHEKGLKNSVQKEILFELQRLYQQDGCQEALEALQNAALEQLDRYEHERQQRLKKRESLLSL